MGRGGGPSSLLAASDLFPGMCSDSYSPELLLDPSLSASAFDGIVASYDFRQKLRPTRWSKMGAFPPPFWKMWAWPEEKQPDSNYADPLLMRNIRGHGEESFCHGSCASCWTVCAVAGKLATCSNCYVDSLSGLLERARDTAEGGCLAWGRGGPLLQCAPGQQGMLGCGGSRGRLGILSGDI